ncbi:hypothetical protein N7522_012743 [Penicillium canescens]|uniref:NmrA-like domain-containing protein n=1 Tax=Penicillium canescens TaxID=5083 RepID=A0AAD6HZ84_PENCN|nr:uncharacterized protein N7446_013204 [Penicillium canescens]KAJ5985547.1 hypothetical protein N7522_012743 [Penicillium canescens]KAJ6022850.1 hypothetical protein N7460_013245 [Penicillium canescens]KAJ6025887.1 hypothetical protein N7444_013566 [Penicillium canescens]KAJ6042138.1 hypothetical protein N7446_013204 [Penicillium canescens]KAJ6158500.1 hypothetical protein N7485_011326 [Penicillium canescens]
MVKLVLITGATGTQGGSIAKLLLQYPEEYEVRCLTRTPTSEKAQALAKLGAHLVQGNLTVPSTLEAAMAGVWGVWGVTDFYDTDVADDPMSEEQQGNNLVQAAAKAGVQCFLWSSLPSSAEISKGKFVTRLYEGKHSVDAIIREHNLPGAFILTGNFYENMILRKYVSYDKEQDLILMKRPVITADAELVTLYVEKDLAGVCKAVWDLWDARKDELNHKHLLAGGARETPGDIAKVLAKLSGKEVKYSTLPTTGWKERDIMLDLYNAVGMYPGLQIPTPEVINLGIKLHTAEDYIRDRLLPHLGLDEV